MRGLRDLLCWLEYGRESGHIAARESKEQEEAWARQLRALLTARDRMSERWADGDDAVKRELWRDLHTCDEESGTDDRLPRDP